MSKKPKESSAICRVQAYLTPDEYSALKKLCAKKKVGISFMVRDFIKEFLAGV